MARQLRRREFLRSSAVLVGTAVTCGGIVHPRPVRAAPIEVPAVDGLAIQVLLDSSHDVFLRPQEVNGVQVERAPRGSDFRRILHNQWGLSLLLQSQQGDEARTLLLDFGYTAEALTNNMELLGVDPGKIDALILSHGHYDHFGGLIGFLQKSREVMPADLTLYAGGEDNFCQRYSRTPTEGQFTDYGVLDRGS